MIKLGALFLAILATGLSQAQNGPLDFVDVINSPRDIELGYRLPNDTLPIRYDIELTTHIHLGPEATDEERFAFEGVVLIHLKALGTTSQIVLHQRSLTIQNAQLTVGLNEEPVQSWAGADIAYDEKFEFLTFDLETPLDVDQVYTLQISYNGVLRTLAGFYRSSYLDENGQRKWLATTQFESTDARHAFPSYDEPGIRAPIGLSIIHGSSYFAVANTPVGSKESLEETLPGYTKTTFIDTPVMQTYLLCFVISDFTFMEAHGGVPQRVYARRQAIEDGWADVGLRGGVKILKALDEYVNLNYSAYNLKIDQIAIPDFAAGAMENWGLVTYREPALLFDEKKDTWADKHSILSIIAHEYAHQYFGNLVSPLWWDYIWLNEGFANLYGYLLVVPTYPEFNDEEIFQLSQLQGVMDTDGYGVTRPMTYYVESPAEVSGLFDNIAYPKSGSVLRMWLHSIGESTWRKGLNYYLTEMALKAATSVDLARGLQKAIDEDNIDLGGSIIHEVIENWSRTAGYPVIHVALTEDGNSLNISQARFTYSPNQPRADDDLWYIPVSFASASHYDFSATQAQFWFKEARHIQGKMPTKHIDWDANDWILLNLKQTGYYRVNYEAKLWDRLITKLNSETFHEIHHTSRSQLLNDAFNLGRAELLDYVTVLRLVEYLQHEDHFLPWDTANVGLSYLNRLLQDTPAGEWLGRYVQMLVAPLYDRKGLRDLGNSETWGDKRARDVAINWACRTGYSTCLDETHKIMHNFIHEDQPIIPDLQQTVLCAAQRSAPQDAFLGVWGKQQNETDALVRQRLLRALGCNLLPELQELYLNTTLQSDNNYRANEYSIIINAVFSSSNSGLYKAIEFLSMNARAAENKYGGVRTHASNMARLISSPEQFEKYRALLTVLRGENIISATDETSYVGISQLNLQWLEANQREILSFLQNKLSSSGNMASLSLTLTVVVTFLLTIFQ